jgi:tRNA threonylcarbamoyladenosine biosynthesis protein TsaB
MNILVFDTSSEALAVGITAGGERWEYIVETGFKHSQALMPAIDRCLSLTGLSKTDLELVACASGPGSFTGLRIGIATAKGLSLALGIPWIGVPTLDSIGVAYASTKIPVIPILDARKNRVYCALFKQGKRIGEIKDAQIQEVLAIADAYPEILFVGPDAAMLQDYALERPGFSIAEADPELTLRGIATLAEILYTKDGPSADDSGPFYLREPEIG